jgi:signal transduction histidine kinase
MTREQIERARLPFQHAWTGYAREADGAGLGLTIADKVITQMGGTLVIESQEDVGTTIIVRLPGVFAVTATNDMVRPDGDMAAE